MLAIRDIRVLWMKLIPSTSVIARFYCIINSISGSTTWNQIDIYIYMIFIWYDIWYLYDIYMILIFIFIFFWYIRLNQSDLSSVMKGQMLSSKYNHTDAILFFYLINRLLLKHGANPNIQNRRLKRTALMEAIVFRSHE